MKNYIEKIDLNNDVDLGNKISQEIKYELKQLQDALLINEAIIAIKKLKSMVDSLLEMDESNQFLNAKLEIETYRDRDARSINGYFYYWGVGKYNYFFEDILKSMQNIGTPEQLEEIYQRNFRKIFAVNFNNFKEDELLKYIIGEDLYIKYNYEKMKSKVGMENNIKESKNKI